jgi:glyoxylase-like metal-dependent hydrolase (beta-lactamase superfamily II)
MHPDHIGMAGWITHRYNCRLWMTRLEYLNCRVLAADTGREAPEDGVRFYRKAGWTADDIETYRARFGNFGKMIHKLPDSYRRLQDGQQLTLGAHEWRVIVGTGHSPEHACFYCPGLKLLISGDQVLPRISSNVSVFPTEPDADPLADWLASLAKIKREVPDDVLVLPAHNDPFRGLHARLDHLATGHERGLERLREILEDEPRRAVDVFGALFARRITDPHLLNLATGESLAHINYLIGIGEAAVAKELDGVAWYQLARTRKSANKKSAAC